MTALSPIPSCIRRFTCEDIAECVSDISEDLRVTLYGFGYRSIESAWPHLTGQERGELASAASGEERRCADMLAAIL